MEYVSLNPEEDSLFKLVTTQFCLLMKRKAHENIVGNGENAGNQHFLIFPQMFSIPSKRNFSILATFGLSSANAFILDQATILSFGKGLTDLPDLSKLKAFTDGKKLYLGKMNFDVGREENFVRKEQNASITTIRTFIFQNHSPPPPLKETRIFVHRQTH